MSRFKPKAETMFQAKMKGAVQDRDFEQVSHLFHLYGCYLELIEPIPAAEIVYVQPDEPTPAQEQEYVLSGEYARFCIETLHRDPVTLLPLEADVREQYGIKS